MAPIPVALCGKNPNMASRFTDAMNDEFHVTHVFTSVGAVSHELPALLKGQSIKPSSGLGSNCHSEKSQAPRAIIVGAGFSRSELDEMRKFEGCKDIPWLYPDPTKMAGTGFRALFGGDFMTSVVNRAKSTMREHGLEEGKEDQVKPDVWGF
nr:hypothetical protein B0A51_01178 [Rachicladosporium sp. CCFEE 5018]